MTAKEITTKLYAFETGYSTDQLKSGMFNQDKILEAKKIINNYNIVIDETASLFARKMLQKARYYKKHNEIEVIIVDYLQLMQGDKQNGRVEEVSSISRALKQMAKELNVPVIALSQLNREVEKRADKRPMLADLRDSGAIEQDADVVLMMYRESMYRSLNEGEPDITEIFVAKNRNGEGGFMTKLLFIPKTAMFVNYQQDY